MKRGTLLIVTASALVGACSTQDRPRTNETRIVQQNPVEIQGDRGAEPAQPTRKPDVIFVPTPEPVVNRMLSMAKVGPKDVVYDLGCGDGRIAIAAAKLGARAVCVDIDPQRIREARANVKREGVEDRVEIRQADLFQVDTSPATVVTLYLLDSLNLKLRPKLQRELRPGSRIVSQTFDMGDWNPEAKANVDGTNVFLWTVGNPKQ